MSGSAATSSPLFPSGLLLAIRDQYRLHWDGIHGAAHWARVLENGLRLIAAGNPARTDVVSLFALFHDACRHNDHSDPEHGARGATLAGRLRGRLFDIDDAGFELLARACTQHTRGETDADGSVLTCWDSDRLDLLRVGIRPSPDRLCTAAARDPRLIQWANDRATRNHFPFRDAFALPPRSEPAAPGPAAR